MDSWQNDGARTDKASVFHADTTAQSGARSNVHAVAKYAFMINRGAVVNDTGPPKLRFGSNKC